MYRIVVQNMFQSNEVHHSDKWLNNVLVDANTYVTPLIARVAVYSIYDIIDTHGILVAHRCRNLSSGRMGKWTTIKIQEV